MKELELLKKLIQFDHSKEGANEALLFCEEWLLSNGLKSKRIENKGYFSLLTEIGAGDKTLLFNGHLDVVGGKKELFIPYEKDGKLYGRGTADMKAGVAAMICALIELKNTPLHCKVQLQLVTDEEIGGEHCSKHLVDLGYKGDFIICGEPTQLGIGVQAKGILQLDLEVRGKSAHGSRPWEGDNAILKAYDLFHKISTLPFTKESSTLYTTPSVNLSKIQGGEVYNKVPDYCKISLDIRFLPEQNHETILHQIKELVGEAVVIHSYGDPVKTSIDDSYVKTLSETTEKFTHTQTSLFGQHGSADTRFYSSINIPAVEFGPCGGNWHGDDEFVVLESVSLYKEILKDFAKNF